jgi:hypothetical protein
MDAGLLYTGQGARRDVSTGRHVCSTTKSGVAASERVEWLTTRSEWLSGAVPTPFTLCTSSPPPPPPRAKS